MNPQHFADALAYALQQLGLAPEEFAREAGLSAFEIIHLLAGEPLPDQNYGKIFGFFLADTNRGRFALTLAKGFLVDSLVDGCVPVETATRLSAINVHDAAVAHLFGGIGALDLLALSEIGRAANHNSDLRKEVLLLAEICRSMLNDQNIPAGFFEQHLWPASEGRKLLGGSIGDLAADLQSED
jgi:hypothetical protein